MPYGLGPIRAKPERDIAIMRAKRLVLAFSLFAVFFVKPTTAQNVCVANVGLASASSVGQWQKWEQSLISTQDYVGQDKRGNPYKDLTIRVTFTSCGVNNSVLSTLQTYGFWYGVEKDATGKLVDRPKSFRIRGSFPVGTWIWQTTCSGKTSALSSTTPPLQVADCANDPGLNQKGKFTVTADSTNSLYRSGLLSLSEDRRYLTYARTYSSSGATQRIPFFWLGDTAWNVPITTTQRDWQTYVNNRAKDTSLDRPSTAFTVVQLAVSPKAAGPADVDGNPPFYQPGDPACPDSSQAPNKCSSWNAKYWAGLDEKIQYANQQGLVVLLAGVMEPLQKLLPTDVSSDDTGTDLAIVADSTALVTFARNVASRYYGNFVVFSPGFDHKVPPNLAVIRLVGQTLRSNTRNLITNHPAGSSAPGDLAQLQTDSWLDFQMYQSGTPGNGETAERENMTDRAGSLATGLQSASLLKSAINGEATYDGAGVYPANHTPYRVRQTAYLSFLSGAMGYTAGTCGLVDWGYGIGGCPVGLGWNAAITRLTSRSMRHLRFILQSVNWQRLRPESLRIQGQSATKPDKKAALAYDGSSAIMAYLPGEPVNIDVDFGQKQDAQGHILYRAISKLSTANSKANFLSSGWVYRWFSPRTGNSRYFSDNSDLAYVSPGVFRFKKPNACDFEPTDGSCDQNDWVLRLTRVGGSPPPPTTALVSSRLEITNETSSTSGDSRVIAQVVDDSTGSILNSLEMGSVTSHLGPPQMAYGPSGNWIVVWQSDSADGTSIIGRVLDAQGNPVTAEFALDLGDSAPGHPSVAALANGNFVVVWSSWDKLGNGPWIRYSSLDRNGSPVSSGQVASACSVVAGDFPQVTGTGEGGFIIALEMKGGSGIYFNQFAADGSSTGSGRLVPGSGWPVLESITAEGSGLRIGWSAYGYDAMMDSMVAIDNAVQNPPWDTSCR